MPRSAQEDGLRTQSERLELCTVGPAPGTFVLDEAAEALPSLLSAKGIMLGFAERPAEEADSSRLSVQSSPAEKYLLFLPINHVMCMAMGT